MPVFRVIDGALAAIEIALDIEVLRARGGVLEALAADDALVEIRLADVGLGATSLPDFVRAVELSYRPGTPIAHRVFALRTVAGPPMLEPATLEALEWIGVPEFAAYARAASKPDTAPAKFVKDIEGFRWRPDDREMVGPIDKALYFGLVANGHFEFAEDAATAGQLDVIEALLELVPPPPLPVPVPVPEADAAEGPPGGEADDAEGPPGVAVAAAESHAVTSAYNAALWAGNLAIAQFILERRPGVPRMSWNEDMREPLSENIRRGNTEMVHWLGAMPAVKRLVRASDEGEDWIGRVDVLEVAILHDRRELLQWLVGEGYRSPENYAWSFAVQHGHIWALDIMRDGGVPPTTDWNPDGEPFNTTANRAVEFSRLEVLQWLVDKGIGLADFNVSWKAIDSGRIDIVEFLINNGATFDPSHIVNSLVSHNDGVTPQQQARYRLRFELLKWLVNRGLFVPTDNDLVSLGVTPVINWLWDAVRPAFSPAVMRRIFRRAAEQDNAVALTWVAERQDVIAADEVLFVFRLAVKPTLRFSSSALDWFWDHMAPFVRTDDNIAYIVFEAVRLRSEMALTWALDRAPAKTRALGLEALQEARRRGASRIMKVLFEEVLTEDAKQTALQDPELSAALSLCGARKSPRSEDAEDGSEGDDAKRKRDM